MTEYSNQKLQFVQDQVVPQLKSIESLKRIGIYGSVAEGRARPDSDIDLIIVCDDHLIHLTRWLVNWRLWHAGLRGRVSAGVVVTESALKPEMFQVDKNDEYATGWLKSIKWLYRTKVTRLTSEVYLVTWNQLAKIFFATRFFFDRLRRYPVPHIKFSDEAFFHFGDSRSIKQNVKSS